MNQPEDYKGEEPQEIPPRRSFFGRVLGIAALGLSGMALPAWAQNAAQNAAPNGGNGAEPIWPGRTRGRHWQLADMYEINGGAGLRFTNNFLRTSPGSAAAVIFRYNALPLALNHAIWKKYKVGESLNIIDPETKAPAVKNPYFEAKPGVLNNDGDSIEKLVERAVVFGACALAMRGTSRQLAPVVGVTPDEALKEWTANVIPGVTVVPSGPWGVNRAQEAGYTYCSGGG